MSENTAIAKEEKTALLNIQLSVMSGERFDSPEKSHASLLSNEKALAMVFKAHGKMCAYCGFKSDKYLEINHKDSDHSNNKISNLVPVCPMCHACFHLGAGKNENSGVLIYWPEIRQGTLNRAMLGLYIAEELGLEDSKDLLKRVFKSFKPRAKIVHDCWGSSKPEDFAKALSSIERTTYEDCIEKTSSLRLIVTPNHSFLKKEAIQYWAKKAKEAKVSLIEDLKHSVVLKDG